MVEGRKPGRGGIRSQVTGQLGKGVSDSLRTHMQAVQEQKWGEADKLVRRPLLQCRDECEGGGGRREGPGSRETKGIRQDSAWVLWRARRPEPMPAGTAPVSPVWAWFCQGARLKSQRLPGSLGPPRVMSEWSEQPGCVPWAQGLADPLAFLAHAGMGHSDPSPSRGAGLPHIPRESRSSHTSAAVLSVLLL